MTWMSVFFFMLDNKVVFCSNFESTKANLTTTSAENSLWKQIRFDFDSTAVRLLIKGR